MDSPLKYNFKKWNCTFNRCNLLLHFENVQKLTRHESFALIPAEAGVFLFTTASRLALRSSQHFILFAIKGPFLRIKHSGHKANSPTSTAEVTSVWHYTPLPHIYVAMWLITQRDNFTFHFKNQEHVSAGFFSLEEWRSRFILWSLSKGKILNGKFVSVLWRKHIYSIFRVASSSYDPLHWR